MNTQPRLTPLQSGIAACLLDGMSDKETAKTLGIEISGRSVSWQLRLMAEAMGTRNRVTLALALDRAERSL